MIQHLGGVFGHYVLKYPSCTHSQDLGKSPEVLWSFPYEPWTNHILVQIHRNHKIKVLTYPNMHVYKIYIPSEHFLDIFISLSGYLKYGASWNDLVTSEMESSYFSVIAWNIYVILIKTKLILLYQTWRNNMGDNCFGWSVHLWTFLDPCVMFRRNGPTKSFLGTILFSSLPLLLLF